jgi:hypothetical protein
MTSETRTMIELQDIIGIEIECSECHTKISFPISDRFKIGPNCPHCNKPLFDGTPDLRTGSIAYPAPDSLRAIAMHLLAMSQTRTDIHGLIRLHINAVAKTKTD